jgi:hypothetical protein
MTLLVADRASLRFVDIRRHAEDRREFGGEQSAPHGLDPYLPSFWLHTAGTMAVQQAPALPRRRQIMLRSLD